MGGWWENSGPPVGTLEKGQQVPEVTAGPSKQSDARDGLDLEFWRCKIVEVGVEGPGPAPKAAPRAAQSMLYLACWAVLTGPRRIEAGFPCCREKSIFWAALLHYHSYLQ